jgi:hypothetical protein
VALAVLIDAKVDLFSVVKAREAAAGGATPGGPAS